MFYAFFLVIPRRLDFIFRRFGTHCMFRIHNQTFSHINTPFLKRSHPSHLPAYEDGTDRRSETSAYKIRTQWSYPEESIQEHVFLYISIFQLIALN